MEANGRNPTQTSHRTRRPRAARACDLCRAKKNKCDESYPCTYCKNRNATCVYQGSHHTSRHYTAEYVKQLEDEVKRLSTTPANAPHTQPVMPSDQSPVDVENAQQQPHRAPQPDMRTSAQGIAAEEISEVNEHTAGVEFYGSSSSMALLSRVQRSGQQFRDREDGAHLVSSLHNATFQAIPTSSHGDILDATSLPADYYPQCRSFIEDFFSTIHYIHPILDKREFLGRCEVLWSLRTTGASLQPSPSFVALYYSVLSLGAMVGVRGEHLIDNLTNLQWSRKFFDLSWSCCHSLGLITNLEMAQCFFMLAKVCQNELNPHCSYMYVGFAVRTALAMGVNRDPGPNTRKTIAQLKAESRMWWCLYSLEVEISFSVGRPDTLGADIHHNRKYPVIGTSTTVDTIVSEMIEPPHCAIIGYMVDLSRITRNICHKMYLSNLSIPDMLSRANEIEKELDGWLIGLPPTLRPSVHNQTQQRSCLGSIKDAMWAKRQKLVLGIRYHNLKILLFSCVLMKSSLDERESVPGCLENTRKCLESARQTITIIYQTYEHNDFFQTWFYNATYTVFAASVVLLYITQGAAVDDELPSLYGLVDMAVEILESMDESVVALKAAKLLRRAKDKASGRQEPDNAAILSGDNSNDSPSRHEPNGPMITHDNTQSTQLNQYWGSFGLIDDTGMDFDMAPQLDAFDPNNPMFLFFGNG
ncbi:hypothetical protein COCMIDRAFT_41389 [Bipolaris oryzae ATCC 44560]|uniref:Zn(2)-C6 fungal-type domain-containing protein n=1 Tax=Bipolaris oryzae ATCC 44560 TaxID=930090 RepID=W6YXJ1_COCMI|nr:uncharacterized protein COCMIDRAFT_41389 [Bipolaris oryzae ATCC 44560]EUC40259.1 hypothetical protein COCMIDRAFT_41389 [Bipolaris oryzae ATCC 44560]